MSRNEAKAGQCQRDPNCTKGNKHAGWCRTKGVSTTATDQDSLYAAMATKRLQPARKQSGRSAAMAELGARRKSGKKRTIDESDEDDDDDDDDDEDFEDGDGEEEEGNVEYSDFGMSRSERKAMRVGGGGDDDDSQADASGGGSSDGVTWATDGPPAPLADLESIRLRRGLLEKWLLEPFFSRVVRGCVVRIGLDAGSADSGGGGTLYRAAEVVGVEEFAEHPYMLGARRTCKRLQLHFGETRQWYPMSSVSNQPFDELELMSWQQVRTPVSSRNLLAKPPDPPPTLPPRLAPRSLRRSLPALRPLHPSPVPSRPCTPHLCPQVLEVADEKLITIAQVQAKSQALQEATNYSYSEADVSKRIEEEKKQAAQQGKPTALTTRQKLAAAHGSSGGAEGGPSVSRPKKFERNVLGQAIVAEHE